MNQGNIRSQLLDKRILLLSLKFTGTHANHSIEDLAATDIHKKGNKKMEKTECYKTSMKMKHLLSSGKYYNSQCFTSNQKH